MENDEYIKGTFVRELKNRFLCEVLVDNRYEKCYLLCSSKISEFIDLTNKIVLLKRNKGTKTKTSFSLFVVCFIKCFFLAFWAKLSQLEQDLV